MIESDEKDNNKDGGNEDGNNEKGSGVKEIHVVGAAFIQDGKALVFQRSDKMKMALKWEFAGGKIEPGESHEQALLREIKEELNLDIMVKRYIASGFSQEKDRRILLHVYECEITGGYLELKEHKQYCWIDIKDMLRLDWPEADLPICREIMAKWGSRQ